MAAGALVRALTDRLPELADTIWTDEDTVEIRIDGARNVDVLRLLRDDPELHFWYLADAAAVDYGPQEHFEVVYHLYSDRHPAWLRIRARVSRSEPHVPTVTNLWVGAMFHEREMYDMMGIVFDGNRDLRRIYMSPDYRSFPQRRDFLLPDDAADSAAAGVSPLERPETWDLGQFREELTASTAPTYAPTAERPEDEGPGVVSQDTADELRPR